MIRSCTATAATAALLAARVMHSRARASAIANACAHLAGRRLCKEQKPAGRLGAKETAVKALQMHWTHDAYDYAVLQHAYEAHDPEGIAP
eukprot:6211745-Pleurochrysis_carterae.AAC.3